MPLYQLVWISTHTNTFATVKSLVTNTAMHVLNAGGVVRNLTSMGSKVLPQRMKRHRAWHTIGDYWVMDFDTSPRVIKSLNVVMRQDPQVIRWTILKRASKLEDVALLGNRITNEDERLLSGEGLLGMGSGMSAKNPEPKS